MDIDHNFFVWLSKTVGLFYLMAMFVAVLIFAYWPSKQKQFEAAAKEILSSEDKPWQ